MTKHGDGGIVAIEKSLTAWCEIVWAFSYPVTYLPYPTYLE